MASTRSEMTLRTLYTCPIPPAPRMPTTWYSPTVVPISRFMICLFVGNFVADFGRVAPGEPAHGRGLIHLGDGERADGVHHAADDPAASGILDVADLAIDGQQVPHLDAVLGADVNNDGAVGRNIRHHAVDLHHQIGRAH